MSLLVLLHKKLLSCMPQWCLSHELW